MSYNWRPVVSSLLKTLQDHNFTLVSVDNGEHRVNLLGMTSRQSRQLAKSEIVSVDESSILVSHPSIGEKLLWLLIVLGNSPEETVADYSVNDILEIALEQFCKKWQNKPCPQY